ncbi:FAD-dependent oxidoreductase [Nocardia bovistercoris]|uniref:ferredoxin--NADP(+) reductase n=1 Tax=Nocardia bovistercoris TaxID=2785916 RepID=A0A931IIW8_9NOCA|nr:FAD-dependent oxidoreductase [Nocardia bovistercoris]MBH0780438.1 FAD-dependent oxidoreductase [Nocardia bovistercoris]
MTHIILGHCCKDASCVSVCPQNCIHPLPGSPGFDSAETLHIDPRSCIDCTACVEVCPAAAIKPAAAVTAEEQRFIARNADYFDGTPDFHPPLLNPLSELPLGTPSAPPRVAIIGSGPSAMYALRELLKRSGSARVTLFEQYDHVGGLLHRGVSRDHPEIREMIALYDKPLDDDRVELILDTAIGAELSLAQVRNAFDAVVLACGASQPRRIGSGDPYPHGVYQAVDLLVADNTGSARFAAHRFGPRCVIIGAGNVALDAVRYLARRNLRVPLRDRVTELIVLSRSPVERASFTPAAFYELQDTAGVDLRADNAGAITADRLRDPVLREILALHTADALDHDPRREPDGDMRVVLSFDRNVTGIEETVDGTPRVVTASGRDFTADTVICAAGFTTEKFDDLPVGPDGRVPNDRGRVLSLETGEPLDGLYVVGWAKRGATGGVGDNRRCAAETIQQLAIDLTPVLSARALLHRA